GNEGGYTDLTKRMKDQYDIHVQMLEGGRRHEVEPGQQAHPTDLHLPPDVGSAAFGPALAGLRASDVLLRGLMHTSSEGVDHPEADVLDVFGQMGLPMQEIGRAHV